MCGLDPLYVYSSVVNINVSLTFTGCTGKYLLIFLILYKCLVLWFFDNITYVILYISYNIIYLLSKIYNIYHTTWGSYCNIKSNIYIRHITWSYISYIVYILYVIIWLYIHGIIYCIYDIRHICLI